MIVLKKIITLLLIYFSFFVFSNSVKAEICDREDIARVKELAKNITVDTQYLGDMENRIWLQSYNVGFNFYDLEGQVAVSFPSKNVTLFRTGEKLLLFSGTHQVYIIYTKCNNTIVRNIDVNLKRFNVYSLKDECKDLDIDMCDPWYQEKISDEEFRGAISKHSDDISIVSKVISFVTKYYIYFIIGGIVIFVFIILLIFINIKKNRLD